MFIVVLTMRMKEKDIHTQTEAERQSLNIVFNK